MIRGVSMGSGGEESNVAFLVGKVDTPQMVQKRIRIIGDGYVDSAGRLEVKVDELWTTVKRIALPADSKESAVTIMENVANSACK